MVSQLPSNVRQPVHLAIRRLSPLLTKVDEVVPEDCSRSAGDRTGWPLSRIILVDSHSFFGDDPRSDHLQQVELGGCLEHRMFIGGVTMKFAGVPDVF